MQKTERKLAVLIIQKCAIAFGIAAMLCAANLIQKQFLYPFSLSSRASLFYLPAAIITLGSLVSPIPALVGIFFGQLISNAQADDLSRSLDVVLISCVPMISAGAAVASTAFFNPRFREFHRPQERFSQIDAIDIFYFCCLYAIINVSLSKLLFHFEIQNPVAFPPIIVLGMAFGDLAGSFLVFVFLNLSFSLYLRFR